ncbi:Calx-beta domain-containing protein [Leifsonia sp. NPDC102414]|uniref:Calx-beta domain-containing protein n=1 Tax=Leifsonia sp. NPDC102414 TaxID=3364124 RepID=UPI0037F25E5F
MAAKYSSIRRMLGVAGLVVAVSGAGVLVQAVTATSADAAQATAAPTASPSPTPSAGPAASADPVASTVPAGTLTPIVDCIVDAPISSSLTARTVLLGYRSTAQDTVRLAASASANAIVPGAADRGQPTNFESGEHHAVWSLTLDGRAVPSATWRLGGATATIDGDVPSCATVTTTALSAPSFAAAGSTVTLTAAVGRLFLSAPADGTVSFSIDGASPVDAAVGAFGIARADLPAPPPGDHTVTARYTPAPGASLRASAGSAPLTVSTGTGALGVTATSLAADGRTATVTVSRASGAGGATVDFTTADGTAIAGADYTATTGSLTFREGQTTAAIDVQLHARAAGSPASTFFVLLQRATTTVDAASATITLPAVPGTPSGALATGVSRTGGPGGDSLLPALDPTSPAPAAGAQDLAMLIGAALLTAGGILGVVGLVRFGGSREARF